MEKVTITEKKQFGFNFIEKDEYKFRNLVNGNDSAYRNLTELEVAALEKNGNFADNWDNVLVKEPFIPELIKNTIFYGKNRIGKMHSENLKFHDFEMPIGITNSRIISSDIGDDCAINEVRYLSNYIIHENCIMHSIQEMQTTNHAKFGNGIVKEGEDENVRVQLFIMNENEKRAVAPFDDMTCADAMLWGNFPEDKKLVSSLYEITDNSYSAERGWYGEIGRGSVIKNCGIIKDVKVGENCYIKGCTKLKNLTIKSSFEEPTQLGESCELVNGIIGLGCRVFYGCKAIRFIMENNSTLKYGARLINSVLGDNSTVSCCEVLSNLLFPFHEQHHNNSFLISSLVMGQSNMAAGANIGSNHNSRSADGEMKAGRGFWPALSSTIKFDSKFASYTIIAKGSYIHELNIKTPFTLVSDNNKTHQREIMPAYWWMYNMYAIERNTEKFKSRDKRLDPMQKIETDYLAPDTAGEILQAIDLLTEWISKKDSNGNVYAEGFENSSTPVKVLKAEKALNAYKDMLVYYGIKEIVRYCAKTGKTVKEVDLMSKNGTLDFTNMGGMLVPTSRVEELKKNIKDGKYKTWSEIHEVYKQWELDYADDKVMNAVLVLKNFFKVPSISEQLFSELLIKLRDTRKYIDDQVYITRKKDYDNPARMNTYRSREEQEAVLGSLGDNAFIKTSLKKTEELMNMVKLVKY